MRAGPISRSRLPLRPGASDSPQVVLATFARMKELETAAANAPTVPADVLGILRLPANADETAVRAKIMVLQAPNDSRAHIREALALPPGADDEAMVAAINELQLVRRKSEAEELVDGAVEAGKLTPAQRQFWLENARADLDAARDAINSMRGQ